MDGKYLRKLRKSKGISQAKMAELLDVDLSTIGKWEIHNVTPSGKRLLELSRILDVSVDMLMGSSESDSETGSEKELISMFNLLDKESQEIILKLMAKLLVKNRYK